MDTVYSNTNTVVPLPPPPVSLLDGSCFPVQLVPLTVLSRCTLTISPGSEALTHYFYRLLAGSELLSFAAKSALLRFTVNGFQMGSFQRCSEAICQHSITGGRVVSQPTSHSSSNMQSSSLCSLVVTEHEQASIWPEVNCISVQGLFENLVPIQKSNRNYVSSSGTGVWLRSHFLSLTRDHG